MNGRSIGDAFVGERGEPRLAMCAVLFIDLLGVREMNASPDVDDHLVRLERAVTGMYRNFLRADSPWPAAFFSDTLVLASPVDDEDAEESAIGGLVIQAAWLQLNLIAQGFFARGALSLGAFHIREGLLFGPALVEAYELESQVAVHPRVVLGQTAVASQREALHFYASAAESPQNALLLRDRDDQVFINYLGLLFDEPEDPRPALALHRDAIRAALAQHRGDKRRWEKYRWVGEYHNHVVSERLQEPEFLVEPGDLTWGFEPFA